MNLLTVGVDAFVEVRHRIQPEAVHSHLQPEVQRAENGLLHVRALEIQIRLMAIKAVPVISLGHRVPGPVGRFEIFKDDAGLPVFFPMVAPDVIISMPAAGCGGPGPLKPGMLIGGMVDDQLGDHPEPPPMGLTEEGLKIPQGAVLGVDAGVIGDVVAVIPEGRRVERQQPDGRDPQVLEIIQLLGEAFKIPDAIPVEVIKRADVDLVDDGVFVPKGVLIGEEQWLGVRHNELSAFSGQLSRPL